MYLWDPDKSEINKKKHGISFEEAKDPIFENRNILVPGVAYSKEGEILHAAIGKFKKKFMWESLQSLRKVSALFQ